ncbi:MAG: aspartate/tyrosine/aromatic aminotransferase [Polyangiaceae bacterium]|nr:aspartate/tyrosine/aromatic aminotransferase [Polyangiaceae bacterium]MCW5792290.1 aspartate/tyrosine/aromatic aminotransferase [Polyangiaceae bacterium]
MFEQLELAPADPILGLTDAFRRDPRPEKVNLGVGAFFDDEGKVPSLQSVRRAEQILAENDSDRSYLPILGAPRYGELVRELLLGDASGARAVTAQAPGGTGALRVAADFIARHRPGRVWLSDPTWANHGAIFRAAGLETVSYRYYDATSHGVDIEGALTALRGAAPGDVVLFHGSCHNPTGCDPDQAGWEALAALQAERGFFTLFDVAYQGFGDGLTEDVQGLRAFVKRGAPMFIASSFSKNFSLYNERVGALTFVGGSEDEALRVASQLKIAVRTNYSNPPRHGAALVTCVLDDAELRRTWEAEVTGMRARLKELRGSFVAALKAAGAARDFEFILGQKGMFSYTGLSAAEARRLTEDHGVYLVSSGRINVAGLTSRSLEYVARAVARVVS